MLDRIRRLFHFVRYFPAYWHACEENIQGIRNEMDALHDSMNKLQQEMGDAIARQLFSMRLTALQKSVIKGPYPNIPGAHYQLDEKLDDLRNLHPDAFDVWLKAFDEGRRTYEADPINNLSVEGHKDAEVFRAFIAPYLQGSVLDVGCGPQELPVYLRGFHLDRVAGIDPLFGGEKRRMEFRQGFAEFLPWADEQFDVVVFATSLDHVLSLEKTLDEVCRVLRPGGKCIVWTGLIPGSARYEPDRKPVVAVDRFHLFHFSEETLLETFRSRFELFERYLYKKINGFYVFVRSEDL